MASDVFCRGCLTKFGDPIELLQYSEKNRRLFVYSTGLQVKRNDPFTFQLCKDCYLNMKVSCKFKKVCKSSDRHFKNYLALKESGDMLDFATYLMNHDDSWSLRLPLMSGNSTPANQKAKEDDNESTCTSIRNFMTDILQAEEIPDSEARIIREVIEEEADILDDSLDSHWLQDDVSIDTDLRLDFSFSAFSTPRHADEKSPQKSFENLLSLKKTPKDCTYKSIEDDVLKNIQHKYFNDDSKVRNDKLKAICKEIESFCNKESKRENLDDTKSSHFSDIQDIIDSNVTSEIKVSKHDNTESDRIESMIAVKSILNVQENNCKGLVELASSQDKLKETERPLTCSIDRNLEEALKNSSNKEISLEDLIASPQPVPDFIPPTPIIKNILYGEKLESNHTFNITNLLENGKCIEHYNEEDEDILKDFFTNETNECKEKEIFEDKMDFEDGKPIDDSIENQFNITNFYCKLCDKTFKNIKSLKLHAIKLHKVKLPKSKFDTNLTNARACEYCGKIYTHRGNFFRHLETHKRDPSVKFTCDTCSLSFSTISRLNMHKRTHNKLQQIKKPVKKEYVCNICGATTNRPSNFLVHLRRHTNNYLCYCATCEQGFYRKSDLVIHLRKHSGERPYSCKYCPRSFIRSDILNHHMKSHTGEREFKCDYCDAKFKKSYDRNHHMKNSKICLQRRNVQQDTPLTKVMTKD